MESAHRKKETVSTKSVIAATTLGSLRLNGHTVLRIISTDSKVITISHSTS